MANEHDRPQGGEPGAERPRVRVNDRRRVHIDEPPAEPSGVRPEAGGARAEPSSGGNGGGGEELEAANARAREYAEHLQRLQAEFDNYRKRVLKEQTRAVEMASEPLVRKLLEVMDEFDLALMAADQKPDFERFLHGVELVYAKLTEILRSEGLERIEADGKPFDPTLHEALMQTGDADGDPFVDDVLRPGYTLKGHVIRPSGVRVVRRRD